jgi:hypothetical protein
MEFRLSMKCVVGLQRSDGRMLSLRMESNIHFICFFSYQTGLAGYHYPGLGLFSLNWSVHMVSVFGHFGRCRSVQFAVVGHLRMARWGTWHSMGMAGFYWAVWTRMYQVHACIARSFLKSHLEKMEVAGLSRTGRRGRR